MGVLDDALTGTEQEPADAPAPDARPSTDATVTRDPFSMRYDTSAIKADSDTVEQIANLAFAVAKVL
jgi:hypothetical protein